MALHVIVPAGIDDPWRPSGGNAYDRRVLDGLAAAGTPVHEHAVAGGWPAPDTAALAGLAAVLDGIADGSVAALDGLVASAAAAVLVPRAGRLRLVVLVHMPLGNTDVAARDGEGAVLHAATAVVTTSAWTRRRLLELYDLPVERVHVAAPGVDPAAIATGTVDGGSLLCVAAVIPAKGHDVLLDALASLGDHDWHCTCVGTLERDPAFVATLRQRARETGLDTRLHLVGPRSGAALDRAYAAADLLVHPSRGETFGMVVSEALARGVPVVATAVGGVPEALGHAGAGTRPGTLVAADDPAALAAALRAWLEDPGLRGRLRAAAYRRRATLPGWETTTAAVGRVLEHVAR